MDIYWILCLVLIFLGQGLNVVGSFVSVPYKNLTFWEAYQMSMSYIIVQRIFLASAIYINHAHSYISNNQIVFLMLCIQFIFTLLINAYYLKKTLSRSDYIGMVLFVLAYYISFFGIPFVTVSSTHLIKEKKKEKQPQPRN